MLINKAELIYQITVNLRKVCNSRPTSILWNLIFHMTSDELEAFRACTEQTLEGATDLTQVRDRWSEALRGVALRRVGLTGYYLFIALQCTVEMMDQRDIDAIFFTVITGGNDDSQTSEG